MHARTIGNGPCNSEPSLSDKDDTRVDNSLYKLPLKTSLKLASLKQRWFDDYKWLKSSPRVMESTPKTDTVTRKRLASTPGVKSCASLLLHPAGNTRYCGAENISCGHHKNGDMFFSVMSRNVPDKVILFKSAPGEKMEALFHLSYITKIGRFGAKEIRVCGSILLGSRTPQYAFNGCTVSSQRYRDQILGAYECFKWVLWAHTTFLWTIMCGHTELTVWMNFMKEWIFPISL
ncbi:hypothetical protein TNCV_3004881 [Trichonephila clavipes]|nr:hypothetical protein TNCV_3004881 [Trichonephila clavipes]